MPSLATPAPPAWRWLDPPAAFLRGFAFAFRDERARPLALLPGAIASALGGTIFALGLRAFDALDRAWIAPVVATADAAGLGRGAWALLASASFAILITGVLATVSLASAPFLERIADLAAGEAPVGNRAPPGPRPGPRSPFARTIRATSGSVVRGLAVAPLGLLPGLGAVAVLAAVGWSAGLGAVDCALRSADLSPERRRRFLREHRRGVLAYGLIGLAVAAVPIAGPLVALPAAYAGAPHFVRSAGGTCAAREGADKIPPSIGRR